MPIPLAGQPTPIQPQQVMSGAAGLEAAGNSMQQAASDVGSAGLTIAKTVSRGRMLNQVNQFNATAAQARESITLNPTPQNITAQRAIVTNAANISKNVDLIGNDSALLQANIGSKYNEFNQAAVTALAQGNRRQNAVDFISGLPDAISDVHSLAASGQGEIAQEKAQAIMEQNQALVVNGSLPTRTLPKTQSQLNMIVQRANMLHSSDNSDPVQQSYQRNIGTGFEPNGQIGSTPTTAGKVSLQAEAQSLQDAKSRILGGDRPDAYITDPKVSNSNASFALSYWDGASHTLAQVQAGVPWNQLQAQASQLNASHVPLNAQQQGQRDKVSQIMSTAKTNYPAYYSTMTNAGINALSDYNSKMSAISNSGVLSVEAKASMSQQAERQYYQGMVAYGQSMGVPASYIKPLVPNDPHMQNLMSAFTPGGDVGTAVSAMRNSGNLGAYMSNSLSSPLQQEASHLAGMSPNVGGSNLIIRSNQTNLQYPTILNDDGTKPLSNSDIAVKLMNNSNIKQYLNYVGGIPNGVGRVASIQKALTNAAKYCTATPGNTLDDCITHIGNNVVPGPGDYMTGTVGNGSQYTFMRKNLNAPLTNAEAEAVSAYAVKKTEDLLDVAGQAKGIDQNKMNAQKVINPLSVTNGPNSDIIVFDPNTGLSKTYPLTPQMISVAVNQYHPAGEAQGRGMLDQSLPGSLALTLFQMAHNSESVEDTKKDIMKNLSHPFKDTL